MALLPGDDGPYVFASPLPQRFDGFRLIDYLAGRFSYQDRATWERRIAQGDVKVDDALELDPSRVVRRDQSVEYMHGEYREPEVSTGWKVVALAEEWMAVAKPSGMPMHSTPRIFRQTLVWQVRRLFGEGWSPVHRLDRDTSGLVIFARGPRTTSWLHMAFERRSVAKDYIALVAGDLAQAVEVDGAIGVAGDPLAPYRQALVDAGKPACTSIRPIGPDAKGRGTWIVASPRQGRMHQIRVHCESIGHPIVGDPLYDGAGGVAFKARAQGAAAKEWGGMVGGELLHLHAWRLRFDHSGPSLLPLSLECQPREGWSVPFPGKNGTLVS